MYGGRFGLSEQSLHVLDDQRIGLDKVPKFPVGCSLSEQSCPVRAVIYHGGDIIHDGVRHAVYACHVLQGGFQFHRGKGAGGKDTLAAVRVVPFFQVILDLLPPVGGIVDIYVRQRSLAGGISHPYLFRLPVGQFGVHAFLAVIPFEATRYGVLHVPLMCTHFQVIRTVVVAVPVDMVHFQSRIPAGQEVLCH